MNLMGEDILQAIRDKGKPKPVSKTTVSDLSVALPEGQAQ
jgi:hypothetical protein